MLTRGKWIEQFAKRSPQWLKWTVKQYRLITSGARTLPDFLILGGRRCGTTSLYNYLTEHPCVLPAMKKEVRYFDSHYERGEAWYRSHFPTIAERRLAQSLNRHAVLTGEATPSYLANPDLIEPIHRLLPNAKLLAILRNPVDAVQSCYYFGLKLGTYTEEQMPFEERVQWELEHGATAEGAMLLSHDQDAVRARQPYLLARHIYVDQLRLWYDAFPRDAIKVLIFEDFIREPARYVNEVFDFLGLPPYTLPSFDKFNSCEYPRISPSSRERLKDYFAPHNERLSEFLGKKLSWDHDAAAEGLGPERSSLPDDAGRIGADVPSRARELAREQPAWRQGGSFA